jgi:nicotinamide mononucleotide adenylyltransferase
LASGDGIMKVGIYAGGFKPFTTGHFSKLADAIGAHTGPEDQVYLYYGMQQERDPEYYKIGPKKGKVKPDKRLRPIGRKELGRYYTPGMGKRIFNIYKSAIERSDISGIRNVTVIPGEYPNTPVSMTIDKIKSLLDDESVEKVTIFGDRETYSNLINILSREPIDLENLVETGWLQLGSQIPESVSDYLDKERLSDIAERGEETARQSLAAYYPDLTQDQIRMMQQVRGTEVRRHASESIPSSEDLSHLGSDSLDVAKSFLPPFLTNDDKEQIINILLGSEESEEPVRESFFPIVTDTTIRRAAARLEEQVQQKSEPDIEKQESSAPGEEAHIYNLYEELSMPLLDIIEIAKSALAGKLENVQEKMDGQYLAFTVVDNELKFFTKMDLETPAQRAKKLNQIMSASPGGGMNLQQLMSKYTGDRSSIAEGWSRAYHVLEPIAIPYQDSLFRNGEVVIASQIMVHENPNTILYSDDTLRTVKPISLTDAPPDEDSFSSFVSSMREASTAEFTIDTVPLPELIESLDEDDEQISALEEELVDIVSAEGLLVSENTVGDYIRARVENLISEKYGFIPENLVSMVADRFITGKGRVGLSIKKVVSKEEYAKFRDIDKDKATVVQEAIIPLEEIIQKIGVAVIEKLNLALDATNHEELASFVEKAREAFNSENILADQRTLEKIRVALARLEKNEKLFKKATEGIVFTYKNKTYKLTGLFTPINKLRGFFAYGTAKFADENTGQLAEGGAAFKKEDETGRKIVVTSQDKITRDEASRILNDLRDNLFSEIGLDFIPVGSTATNKELIGDIDIVVNEPDIGSVINKLQSSDYLSETLVDNVERIYRLPGGNAVAIMVQDMMSGKLFQVDIFAMTSPSLEDAAWEMSGGGEGEVKGVYHKLLFSLIANDKSSLDSTPDATYKHTVSFPGGYRLKIDGELRDRVTDPDEYLPILGIDVDKEEINTFEKLVSYMTSHPRFSKVILRFKDYIDNKRYLQSTNENIRQEAEKAVNYIDNKLSNRVTLERIIRRTIAEDIVYNSAGYGTIEVDDDGTEASPATSNLADLYQENIKAGNKGMAGLIKLLNAELVKSIQVNDPAAWERIGELMLSNLGFIQQTDIEGGPKVATFYDVLRDGAYYSVKTSFAKFARSPQTAFGASALKLSQLTDFVMLPENAGNSYGCIGCIKRRPNEIHWGITPVIQGGDIKINFESNTPERMKDERGVQFENPNVFVKFQEPYKGRGTRLGASAAQQIFGNFQPLWTIVLMDTPEIDAETEALRLKLMQLIGASQEEMIQKIVSTLSDQGLFNL